MPTVVTIYGPPWMYQLVTSERLVDQNKAREMQRKLNAVLAKAPASMRPPAPPSEGEGSGGGGFLSTNPDEAPSLPTAPPPPPVKSIDEIPIPKVQVPPPPVDRMPGSFFETPSPVDTHGPA